MCPLTVVNVGTHLKSRQGHCDQKVITIRWKLSTLSEMKVHLESKSEFFDETLIEDNSSNSNVNNKILPNVSIKNHCF